MTTFTFHPLQFLSFCPWQLSLSIPFFYYFTSDNFHFFITFTFLALLNSSFWINKKVLGLRNIFFLYIDKYIPILFTWLTLISSCLCPIARSFCTQFLCFPSFVPIIHETQKYNFAHNSNLSFVFSIRKFTLLCPFGHRCIPMTHEVGHKCHPPTCTAHLNLKLKKNFFYIYWIKSSFRYIKFPWHMTWALNAIYSLPWGWRWGVLILPHARVESSGEYLTCKNHHQRTFENQ